jgi:hypothetical protein
MVCCQDYDTINLLMDTRLVNGKQRETFEHKTVTGWGLCPADAAKKPEYIALVECDPAKGGQTLSDVYRTGRVAHMRRTVFPEIFGQPCDPEQPMCFVTPDVMGALVGMAHPSDVDG